MEVLIIYKDNEGRVYTYTLKPMPKLKSPSFWFIFNYTKSIMKDKTIYASHMKISRYMEDRDIEDFNYGIINQIVDCYNGVVYNTHWERPGCKLLYNAGCPGLGLN